MWILYYKFFLITVVAVVGLEVPHVHVHLIPLQDMDDMRFERKVSLEKSEFEQIPIKIANNL